MHVLEKKIIIKTEIDTAWDFFSNPKNLAKITPPELDFKITYQHTDEVYKGCIISYKVKPLLGIPISWVTEITEVDKNKLFIDEQRFGPYKFWHHKHFFNEVPEGVEAIDIVHYKLPLEPFSNIALPFVRKQLNDIFDFREEKLGEIFS